MKSLTAVTLVIAVFCAVPLSAAYDAFLKLEGIKGESKDASHQGWIEIESFSWGTPAAAAMGTMGCATGEMRFSVAGNAVPLLTQMCQRNERIAQVTIDFMNTRHVLQGATFRSCANNLFTVRFDRCATHPAAATRPAAVAINPGPNGQLLFGNNPAESLNVVGVRPQGTNNVIILQRGASPALARYCARGQHYPAVTLTCRKAGGTQQEYLKIKMTDVLVTSYQVNGDGTVAIGLQFASTDGSFAGFQDIR